MEPMQTSSESMKTESYFEKNKKMVIIFTFLLIIFLGILAYAYSLYHPAMSNNAINGTVVSEPIVDTPTPVVSSPVTEVNVPTPQSNPDGDYNIYNLEGKNFDGVTKTYTVKIPTDLIQKNKAADKSYPGTLLLVADGFNLSVSVHSEGAITYNPAYNTIGNNTIFGTVYRSTDTQQVITSYGNVLANQCPQGVEGDCGTYTAGTALKADSLDAYFDVKVSTSSSSAIFNDIDTMMRAMIITKSN